jgi:hypothetical protein
MSFLRSPAAFLLLGVATASADPKQLDCTLTDLGSVAVSSQQTESRPVTVTFDEAAGTLSISRDGTTRALSHVTMSVEYRPPDLRRSFDTRRIRKLQIAMKRARPKDNYANRSVAQLRCSLGML